MTGTQLVLGPNATSLNEAVVHLFLQCLQLILSKYTVLSFFCLLKKKKDEITIRSSAAEYLTYVAAVGDQQDSIEMRYEDENIWLTQKIMATLYGVGLPAINEHIKRFMQIVN